MKFRSTCTCYNPNLKETILNATRTPRQRRATLARAKEKLNAYLSRDTRPAILHNPDGEPPWIDNDANGSDYLTDIPQKVTVVESHKGLAEVRFTNGYSYGPVEDRRINV